MNTQEFQKFVINQFSLVATKEDLQGFATKEDLNGFATKEDLNSFATKEDLKGFATKEDLKSLAMKDDLQGFAMKEDINLVYLNMATKTELAEVKEIVTRLDKRSDEDIRATIKDVEKIKIVLTQQGHQI